MHSTYLNLIMSDASIKDLYTESVSNLLLILCYVWNYICSGPHFYVTYFPSNHQNIIGKYINV